MVHRPVQVAHLWLAHTPGTQPALALNDNALCALLRDEVDTVVTSATDLPHAKALVSQPRRTPCLKLPGRQIDDLLARQARPRKGGFAAGSATQEKEGDHDQQTAQDHR